MLFQRRRRLCGAWLLAGALSLAMAAPARTALAEPTAQDRETARGLLEDGGRKLDAKDYAGALKSFQAAHAIMGVPTTAIEVANAHEALGQLVEERDVLVEASRYPQKPGEPTAFTKARAEATQRAQKLAARIASVKVSVSGPPPGAELDVKVDGAAVPPAAATLPRKVNPGKHVVTASARGFAESKAELTLQPGQNAEVRLALAPGSAAPAAAAGPPGLPPPSAAPVSYGSPPKRYEQSATGAPGRRDDQPEPETTQRRSKPLFITGIVLMGIGGIGAAVGGAAIAEGSQRGKDGEIVGGAVGVGLGAAVLVTGLVMTLYGAKKVPKPAAFVLPATRLEPVLGLRSAGLRWQF